MLTNIATNSSGKLFPYDSKVHVLPNGLKFYVIQTPVKGIVSYYSVVRTGSRDEWEEGHSGFAHFFEHMMFRGTKKYPGHVYDSITVAMGANANAYTTDDYTCYHLTTTTDNLEKVIELESDRFQNLSYEEDPFKTESGAVYGEYRKGKTDPFFVLYEKMMETAFDKHTYRHTTIGFEKDVAAMPTMYDFSITFFKRYYRPENTIIMVVGDVQNDNVSKLIEKYYKSWQKGYATPFIQSEPAQTAQREASVSYPGKTLPIIAVAYKSLAYNASDIFYVSSYLVGEMLFGETSDIYKKLVINEQKVQVLATEFSENRDPNLNTVYAMIKDKKDIDYVKSAIMNEFDRIISSGIDQKKLDALKKRMKYAYLMNLDTPDKVAGGMAREIALTGGIEAIEQFFRTLDKVTATDMTNAIKTLFIAERRTIVTLTGGK
jgi:zinc protease